MLHQFIDAWIDLRRWIQYQSSQSRLAANHVQPILAALADPSRRDAPAVLYFPRPRTIRVAEGAENKEQLAVLNALDCDCVQGYVLARPMPGDAFMKWAKAFSAGTALEPLSSR